MADLALATFNVDATPPPGHPLCGGWIKPVEGVDDRLSCRGVILLGVDRPIVLATVDWTGVLNDSFRLWTERLAEAAGTTPDRVALHTVHQHNAPFVDARANRMLQDAGSTQLIHDDAAFESVVARSVEAVRSAIGQARPVSRIRTGRAAVREVASNRRILGPDGRVQFVRTSATKDPEVRAAPEGLIDPILKSISFAHNGKAVARIYSYATHPMSYYGDGRVSGDFPGLARYRRDCAEPGVLHLYFTGCAGDITAGKYNDGSKGNRAVLADRIEAAMIAADDDPRAREAPLESVSWRTLDVLFPPREDLKPDEQKAIVGSGDGPANLRNRAAMVCSWLERVERKDPIVLKMMEIGPAGMLLLPAETFVDYQLHAQAARSDIELSVAAYGDGGPWYIPLAKSYAEGGYEPSASFVSPATEAIYREALERIVKS